MMSENLARYSSLITHYSLLRSSSPSLTREPGRTSLSQTRPGPSPVTESINLMANSKNISTEILDLAEVLELTVAVPFEYTPKSTDRVYIITQQVYVERVTPDL